MREIGSRAAGAESTEKQSYDIVESVGLCYALCSLRSRELAFGDEYEKILY